MERIMSSRLPIFLPLLAAFAILLMAVPNLQAAATEPLAARPNLSDAQKSALAAQVRAQTLRSSNAYKKYAWGHDELHPLSRKPFDWYGHSFFMIPVDAIVFNTEAHPFRRDFAPPIAANGSLTP
jgi:hypothetical protein